MHHVHKISYSILIPSVLVSGMLMASYEQKYATMKANPEKYAQESVQQLMADVSQLITLPTNEMPTVATVTDPTKLKDQPFFTDAKVGDRVLIYTGAKKAILYDPVARKIMQVAPLFLGATQASAMVPAQK